jgi:hypothetical protein
MAKVSSNKITEGTIGVAYFWTNGPDGSQVTLGLGDVDLAPGSYVLQWELRADVGSSATFSVSAIDPSTGRACTTGRQTVPLGKVQIGSGSDSLPGYKPLSFVVK